MPDLTDIIGAPELASAPKVAPVTAPAPADSTPASLAGGGDVGELPLDASGSGGLATPLQPPVPGIITSGFGERPSPIEGSGTNHPGIDFRAATGTTVGAAAPGTVEFAGPRGGFGNAIVIKHPDGFSTLYGHLSGIFVNQGDAVNAGQPIGLSGSTGLSTGPHVHFGYYDPNGVPIDPTTALTADASASPATPTSAASLTPTAGGGPDLTSLLGLTPQERTAIAAQTAPAPTTPAGQAQGSGQEFNFGPKFAPMSQAAEATYHRLSNDPTRGLDPNADPGSPKMPYYASAGTVVPVTPGVHWIDADGNEHTNPGGALEQAGSALAGLAQGAVMDTAASASRLTGGGIGVPTDPDFPMANAAASGGVSDAEMATATRQGIAQQQQDYHIQHLGDPYAQAGRFVGQALPATAAAAAVPEIEAPGALAGSALEGLATGAAKVGTNALRGVGATAPTVGTNSAPLAQQFGTGALAGVAIPAILGKAAELGQAATGIGQTVSPDVAALADAAQTKYNIPLRTGQILGANGDRGAAYADSNLLGSSARFRANAEAQRDAWMRGVTGTYGDPSGDVGPQALTAAKATVVAPMNDVAGRTNIVADPVQTQIGGIIADAQKVLPDNEVAPLLKLAESVGDVRQGPVIPGEAYQALTRTGAPLDRLIQSSDPNVSHYAAQIRGALDDGLQASAAPEDVAALQNARWQYKNLLTVAKLAPRADPVTGAISPALLRGAVNTNFKNSAFAGAGDLGELAQIGQAFMKEPPQSGTAPRVKDMLSSLGIGAGAAGATELAQVALHRPENALGAFAAAGLGTGAKIGADALRQARLGPAGAPGLIARSLPNAPRSALAGVTGLLKPLDVPLSALTTASALGSLQQRPALSGSVTVGANAQ